MSEWREINSYELGPIRFLSNGTFDFGVGPMPLGMALNNCNVDQFTISKPAEEDGVITVEDAHGAQLQARWTGRCWSLHENDEHVAAYGAVAIASESGGNGDAASQLPKTLVPFPIPRELMEETQPAKPFPWRGFGAFALVALVVLAFVYQKPIGAWYNSQKAAAEARDKQREAEAAYRALEGVVAKRLQLATTKLEQLEKARREMSRAFDGLSLGISLDVLAADDSKSPHQVDVAIVEDAEFSRAWSALLNAYFHEGLANAASGTLEDLARRQDNGTLMKSDETDLVTLADKLEEGLADLSGQGPNLETVRKTLARRRSD